MTGFEPAAPASQKQCSTKLSYIPLFTEVIITLLVPPVKWFPVLPSIMMHCPHTQNGNKHKKKPHHSKTPWSLHNRSNEQLNVVHYPLYRPGHVSCIPAISNEVKTNTNNIVMGSFCQFLKSLSILTTNPGLLYNASWGLPCPALQRNIDTGLHR